LKRSEKGNEWKSSLLAVKSKKKRRRKRKKGIRCRITAAKKVGREQQLKQGDNRLKAPR